MEWYAEKGFPVEEGGNLWLHTGENDTLHAVIMSRLPIIWLAQINKWSTPPDGFRLITLHEGHGRADSIEDAKRYVGEWFAAHGISV